MRLGLRLKLFLVSLALTATSVVVADAFVTRSITAHVAETLRSDLLVRARLVAREASTLEAGPSDVAAWDALADAQGRIAEARVTLIGPDGAVLGDSEVDTASVPAIENHRGRPEVIGALSAGSGEGARLSATIHERMLYVAVPFVRRASIAGVARLAMPLREVDQARAVVRRLIFGASGAALLLAVFASSVVAHRLSRSVEHLTNAARRMTGGDLRARTGVTGDDELSSLGTALDALATSLSGTLDELRAERDLLGRILEGMQEGVLMLDKGGRVVLVNAALRAMVLLGPDSRGHLLIEVVRHAHLDEVLRRAASTREVVLDEIDVPGLKPRRLLVHAAPIAGDDGGVLAVFVDVTELRRLESLRRDFVANVSHELRTPVAAVCSATETLRAGAIDDPDAARRFVDIVDRNAKRLQSLIEDLLELSRIDHKEFRLARTRVDVGGVVRVVRELFRERAEAKRIRLLADAPATPLAIEGDGRALEQIFTNLADNAVKYCPPGAAITVTAAIVGERVVLRVADTGPGIDARHVPRLFERFYRVDAGRSRDVGGTGLGLSIVKHLTEAMGGTVSVESEVGKGSTFVITLTAAKD